MIRIIIHDSDDGLGPIYSYVIDDTVYGPQFHEQSVFPPLFPLSAGPEPLSLSWSKQTVLEFESLTPSYSGATVGIHPDTRLPYTFNRAGVAMTLERSDDGSYRWILSTAGDTQTDVVNLFTAYLGWLGKSQVHPGKRRSAFDWDYDDWDRTLSRMNLYRRNGFLYAFEGYYLTSFAAAPAGDARFPGFWRGGRAPGHAGER